MTEPSTPDEIAGLGRYPTTIGNVIEARVPERRGRGFTPRPVQGALAGPPPMAGHAKTAMIGARGRTPPGAQEARQRRRWRPPRRARFPRRNAQGRRPARRRD